jgi:hypothetical protein
MIILNSLNHLKTGKGLIFTIYPAIFACSAVNGSRPVSGYK